MEARTGSTEPLTILRGDFNTSLGTNWCWFTGSTPRPPGPPSPPPLPPKKKPLAIKGLQHLARLTLFPRAGTLLRRGDGRRGEVHVGRLSSHVACDGHTGDGYDRGPSVNGGGRRRWRGLTEDESGDLPALLGGHVLHRVQRRQALLVNHVHVHTCWTTGEK